MRRLLAHARAWIRGLFARATFEREMQHEMAQHLERSVERLIARGMTADAARAEAVFDVQIVTTGLEELRAFQYQRKLRTYR